MPPSLPQITAMYAGLFATFSAGQKQELIALLASILPDDGAAENQATDTAFYQTFGALTTEEPAE